MTTGDVHMTLQLDPVDIAKIAAMIRHEGIEAGLTMNEAGLIAGVAAKKIAEMLGALDLPVTVSIADVFGEDCEGCGQRITTPGLCANCVARQREDEQRRAEALGISG